MLRSVRSHWGPVVYDTSTNSLGFRDTEARTVPLQRERFRILLIGDSFTEGLGVDFASTFAGRIQQELQTKGIEILNAGVASYSPIIYYRKLQYLLEQVGLELDYVIVFLDMSDVQDEVGYHFDTQGNVVSESDSLTVKSEAHQRARKASTWKAKINHFVEGHMTLGAALLLHIRRVYGGPKVFYAVNKRRALWSIEEQVFEAYAREGLAKAQTHMDMLYAILAARGIPLTVAVYPWPDQVFYGDLHSKQVTFWRAWAQEHHCGFFNLFPDFIASQDTFESLRHHYIPQDVHWSSEGHRVVADALLRYMCADPVLRRFPGNCMLDAAHSL